MSLAVVDHQTEALAKLAQYLRGKPNLEGVLKALNNRSQEIEVALQSLLLERSLATAVGAQLDVLGALVGQQRGGLSDADYRVFVGARIKVNNSSGTVPEILEVFELVMTASTVLKLRDEPPAAFTLELNVIGYTNALAGVLVGILRTMRAAGVRGLMEYGNTATATAFKLDAGTSSTGLDNGHFRGTLL